MSSDLTPPPPPSVPATQGLPVGNPLTTLVEDSTFAVLKKLDIEAYLEMVARTEPRLFQKYVALAVNSVHSAARLAVSGADNRNQTIVNVMNAIPRSPLDELPEGFRTK